MARLNEPPAAPAVLAALQPGAESVDALKRRFIRQNRELAKNNSNHSLRIRSLELEVSRLLTDNLDLREKVFRLEGELFSARGQVSSEAVQRVKEELRAKIAELSGLVGGLNEVVGQQEDGNARPPAAEKKPIEGQWRERQPLTEAMRENQMPTIVEDKQYPRRTLGADEIQAIRLSDHSSNESPDLGPPPIAHFDYEDPVKHASPSASRTSPKTAEEDVLPGLSVNLETRRKRKDGQPKLEIRRHSILSQSPEKKDSEGSTMLRTGAKRKLADRDAERSIKAPSKDDFTFVRRTAPGDSKVGSEQAAAASGESMSQDFMEAGRDVTATPPKLARRVLGDKSVNMSPRKVTARSEKSGKEDQEKPAKPPAARSTSASSRSQSRTRRISALPLPSPPRDHILATIEIPPPSERAPAELPPKTPAASDLFSPTPSEPSARPTESRAGTPPPSDLSTLSTATNGDGVRPSRRARAAVNYAEPSLMAKMRRPSKQFVDAISGLQDPRRAMSVTGERKVAGSARTVVIKQEPEDDDAWKNLPPLPSSEEMRRAGSPVGVKSSSSADGSSDPVLPVESSDGFEQQAMGAPSAASATISALIAGSRKRRDPHTGQHPPGADIDAATSKLADMDIYDFTDSSSPADHGGNGATSAVKERSHRRHSSVPKDLPMQHGPTAVETVKPVSGVAGGGRSERAASRRRKAVPASSAPISCLLLRSILSLTCYKVLDGLTDQPPYERITAPSTTGNASVMEINKLYSPELVRIIIKPTCTEFQVPRALICGKSAYFEKAFSVTFTEGHEGVITLPDVELWIFECFVGWLYTGRVFRDPAVGDSDAHIARQGTQHASSEFAQATSAGIDCVGVQRADTQEQGGSIGRASTDTAASDMTILAATSDSSDPENDEDIDADPITWPRAKLVQLYIFADQYDTRHLRNTAMDVVLIKALQNTPQPYIWPHWDVMATVFESLPEQSRLYKFWIEGTAYDMLPTPLELCDNMQILPKAALVRLLSTVMQLDRLRECEECVVGDACDGSAHPDIWSNTPPYFMDVCLCHEHQGAGDERECRVKWVTIIMERGIRQDDNTWRAHLENLFDER
ncbi:hypothetical protein LTR85_006747 [Meristemomyces frigidus]|nr:hypothetical protein LTR85_006747 [Meristemomyces frigidus]